MGFGVRLFLWSASAGQLANGILVQLQVHHIIFDPIDLCHRDRHILFGADMALTNYHVGDFPGVRLNQELIDLADSSVGGFHIRAAMKCTLVFRDLLNFHRG